MFTHFTTEEKFTTAAIFKDVLLTVSQAPIVASMIRLVPEPSFVKFANFCSLSMRMTGLDEITLPKTSISKIVWNNMAIDKKKTVLFQLNEIETVTVGTFFHLNAMHAIRNVLTKLGVSNYSHDENGFHFSSESYL